jgi:fluoroacetyl-CoA thioesterase
MSKTLQTGLTAEVEIIVNEENTAAAYGSGSVQVFATPAMIALMENAAMKAVDRYLEAGQATVGTSLDVKHIAATPLGMKVRAEAVLNTIEGKKLTFAIEAFDEKEKIGEGSHTRYIINVEKFMEKVKFK